MKLGLQSTSFTKVSDIEIPNIFFNRMKCGVEEFDGMFGEGLLPGAALTFTGQAGVGKSTALLQYMEALADNGYDIGYASGEENTYQLAYTCRRLNVKSVAIANETDIDVLAAAMNNLDVLVVDSFQALTCKKKMNNSELERYAVSTLVSKAKETECAIIFVLHYTKSGNSLKGSTLIPHSVDINFKIEMDPEGEEADRIINVYKNRFGPTGMYGATMTHRGLQLSGKKEVVATPNKAARQRKLLNGIMELDPPNITKELIKKKFNLTESQAYLALKELTDSDKLIKIGRGKTAVWKKKITVNA